MPENQKSIISLIGQVCPQADCAGILAPKHQGAECPQCKTYVGSLSDWQKTCRYSSRKNISVKDQLVQSEKNIVSMHAVNIAGEGF